MPEVPTYALAWLVLAAFVAAVVDAIAGGGGVLTLPSLLAAGLPPHLALGTNKGQSVFGSAAALLRFWRAGLVHGPRARVAFPAGFVGALAGAQLVLLLSKTALRPLVLGLLVLVAVFLAVRPQQPTTVAVKTRRHPSWVAAAIALVIGAYDGFFGPGTGTFLIFAFVFFFDSDLTRASADAKIVNFASNLASVVLFAARGTVVWQVALPMAVAQFLGASVGAQLAVRGGDRLVRRCVLLVVTVLVVKLALDLRG